MAESNASSHAASDTNDTRPASNYTSGTATNKPNNTSGTPSTVSGLTSVGMPSGIFSATPSAAVFDGKKPSSALGVLKMVGASCKKSSVGKDSQKSNAQKPDCQNSDSNVKSDASISEHTDSNVKSDSNTAKNDADPNLLRSLFDPNRKASDGESSEGVSQGLSQNVNQNSIGKVSNSNPLGNANSITKGVLCSFGLPNLSGVPNSSGSPKSNVTMGMSNSNCSNSWYDSANSSYLSDSGNLTRMEIEGMSNPSDTSAFRGTFEVGVVKVGSAYKGGGSDNSGGSRTGGTGTVIGGALASVLPGTLTSDVETFSMKTISVISGVSLLPVSGIYNSEPISGFSNDEEIVSPCYSGTTPLSGNTSLSGRSGGSPLSRRSTPLLGSTAGGASPTTARKAASDTTRAKLVPSLAEEGLVGEDLDGRSRKLSLSTHASNLSNFPVITIAEDREARESEIDPTRHDEQERDTTRFRMDERVDESKTTRMDEGDTTRMMMDHCRLSERDPPSETRELYPSREVSPSREEEPISNASTGSRLSLRPSNPAILNLSPTSPNRRTSHDVDPRLSTETNFNRNSRNSLKRKRSEVFASEMSSRWSADSLDTTVCVTESAKKLQELRTVDRRRKKLRSVWSDGERERRDTFPGGTGFHTSGSAASNVNAGRSNGYGVNSPPISATHEGLLSSGYGFSSCINSSAHSGMVMGSGPSGINRNVSSPASTAKAHSRNDLPNAIVGNPTFSLPGGNPKSSEFPNKTDNRYGDDLDDKKSSPCSPFNQSSLPLSYQRESVGGQIEGMDTLGDVFGLKRRRSGDTVQQQNGSNTGSATSASVNTASIASGSSSRRGKTASTSPPTFSSTVPSIFDNWSNFLTRMSNMESGKEDASGGQIITPGWNTLSPNDLSVPNFFGTGSPMNNSLNSPEGSLSSCPLPSIPETLPEGKILPAGKMPRTGGNRVRSELSPYGPPGGSEATAALALGAMKKVGLTTGTGTKKLGGSEPRGGRSGPSIDDDALDFLGDGFGAMP